MKTDRKGVTLISVMIIIVVLSILAGIVTVSTDYIIDDTYEREFIREYKLVKSYTKDYIKRNSGIINFEETTFDLSSVLSENLSQFDGETIVDNIIDVYVIDLEEIGVENATYGIKSDGDEDDVYVLSKTTNTIYYKKGFVNDDNIYYKSID